MESVLVERDGGVVTVTLHRPERKNAIDGAMWDALTAAFDEVAANRDDRVLVLTGAGDAFCSGADLTDSGNAQPSVGHVAVGFGCNLALGCDLVVASDAARFSEIFLRRAWRSTAAGRGCSRDWSDCTRPRSWRSRRTSSPRTRPRLSAS